MTTPPTRSPWVLGLLLAFAVMLAVNAIFAWIAVKGSDPVAASYNLEPR